jgi:multicomponent K+:H+ antiporter subunit E
MIQALLPQPLLSLVIAALWLALAPAMSVGNLLLGACLGLAIPWITARFWPDRPRLARPLAGVALFLRVLGDIVVANWQVARLVLGPLDRLHPAFVKVPLEIDDPLVATVLASIVSLTPGTVSVDIDRERKALLVHALDAGDPLALAATIKARYEAPLKEIFQC